MRRACQLGLLSAVVGCGGAERVADRPQDGLVPKGELEELQERFDKLLAEYQATGRGDVPAMKAELASAREDVAKSVAAAELANARADRAEADNAHLRELLARNSLAITPRRDAELLPAVEESRREAFGELLVEGVVLRLSRDEGVPRLFVLPKWFAQTRERKEEIAAICYAYAYRLPEGAPPRKGEWLFIADSTSKKAVGAYGERGLLLDEYPDAEDFRIARRGSAATTQEVNAGAFTLIDLAWKVTEKNDTWWRYSWVAKIRNNTAGSITCEGKVQWLDSEGFELDFENTGPMVMRASGAHSFSGSSLIDADVAPQVGKATIEVVRE
ncbi:MAG: hypothetical protein AAGJ46_21190 [Planctomycetota bacterium]